MGLGATPRNFPPSVHATGVDARRGAEQLQKLKEKMVGYNGGIMIKYNPSN